LQEPYFYRGSLLRNTPRYRGPVWPESSIRGVLLAKASRYRESFGPKYCHVGFPCKNPYFTGASLAKSPVVIGGLFCQELNIYRRTFSQKTLLS